MRLLLNGAHSKLPSHLTRRPITSPRTSLRGRQQRKKSSEPSKDHSREDADESASSKHSQDPSNPTKASRRPVSGSVVSSAGASTPPFTNGSTSRSFSHILQAGPVGRFARSYSRVQDRRPYLTQICSSIVIYLCGDLTAQYLFPSEPGKSTTGNQDGDGHSGQETGWYDPLRTLRHLTVGIGSSIPSYNWLMFLHNNFNFASKFLSILTKVVVQQLCFTPVFNTYFFSVHSILAGASLDETLERLWIAVPTSFVNSCKLWPLVTAFSFMYVPPQFRNVFAGIIAVGWQTYLSWLNQEAANEVELEDGGSSPRPSPSNGELRAGGTIAPA